MDWNGGMDYGMDYGINYSTIFLHSNIGKATSNTSVDCLNLITITTPNNKPNPNLANLPLRLGLHVFRSSY